MAFPTVSSITPSSWNTLVTSHPVAMPATVDAGDLLLVLWNTGNTVSSTTTTPSGWSVVATTTFSPGPGTVAIYAKDAAGTEDGSTVDFVTSSGSTAVAQVYRIPASSWFGTISTGVEASSPASGTSTSPNPASLNPSNWDTEDTVWIVFLAKETSATTSAYPTNYSTGQTQTTEDNNDVTINSARRELAAASEDPGTFTLSASRAWTCYTIAIRPAAGAEYEFAGSQTVSFDGTAAMVQTATFTDSQTVSFDGTAAMIQTATFTGAETVSMDGTAALKQTANLTGAETVSFDGSIGTVQIEHHFEGAETVSFDGTADTVLNHWLMDGAQSVSFDGSAALKQTATLTGGETVSFDGTAALDIAAIAFDGQGVLSFDGSIATLNLILEMEAAAAVSFDGEAALGQQALFEGAATLSFDGIAALTGFQWDPVETPASTTWSDVD